MEIARHIRWLERQWSPDLRQGPVERAPRRQDAGHGVWRPVQQYCAVEDRHIAPELVLPKDIAEDRDLVLAALILVGNKRAAKIGFDPKDIEILRGDLCPAKLGRNGISTLNFLDCTRTMRSAVS
jgi:hypothetical protein